MNTEIEHIFRIYKNQIAYIYKSTRSYREYSYNEVCEFIRQFGKIKFKGNPVAVHLDKNICLLTAILSFLKAKVPFILLQGDINSKENGEIIKALKIAVVFTHEVTLYSNQFTSSFQSCCGETMYVHALNCETEQIPGIVYMIQTSGTTGKKKYVKVTENCIYANVKCLRERMGIVSNDVIYFGTPLTFDPYVIELFIAVTTGSTLFATSTEIRACPNLLLKALIDHKVTVLQMCPSIFLQWSAEDIQELFLTSSLNVLALGGEQFPEYVLNYERRKGLRLFNLYGITEVSCWASLCEVTDEVSLGRALDETILEVRNENNEIVRHGEGVLYVGSSTRICFIGEETLKDLHLPLLRSTGDVVHVKNSKIFYRGRHDDTVKRFGHRVNLSDLDKLVQKSVGLRSKSVCHVDEYSQVTIIDTFILLPPKLQNCKSDVPTIGTKDSSLTEQTLEVVTRVASDKINDKFEPHELEVITKNASTSASSNYIPKHKRKINAEDGQSKRAKTDFRENEKILDKITIKLRQDIPSDYFPDHINLVEEFPVTTNGKIDVNKLKEKSTNSVPKNTSYSEFFKKLWFKYFQSTTNATFAEMGGNSIMRLQFSNELQQSILDLKLINILLDSNYEEACRLLNGIQESKEANMVTYQESKHFSIRWKYYMNACVDTTATIISNSNKYVAIGNYAGIFSVLDCSTGKEISKIQLPKAIENCCLTGSDNKTVFVGCSDGVMYCLDVCTCNILWSCETGDKIKNTGCLILNDSVLVFGSYDKNLYAVHVQDGTIFWKLHIGEAITADVICKSNNVFVGSIKGLLKSVEGKTGVEKWNYRTKHPIFAAPVFSTCNDMIIFIDIFGFLYCFGIPGDLLWIHNSSQRINTFSSVLISGDLIIYGDHNKCLHVLKYTQKHCKALAKIDVGFTISTKPVIIPCHKNFRLIFSSNEGIILMYQFDGKEFRETDLYHLYDQCFSNVVICDNKLYVGCRDNNLYCLDINL